MCPHPFGLFREKISLLRNPRPHDRLPPRGHHLAIRLYSSSPLTLLELRCELVLRLRARESDAGKVGRFQPLTAVNPSWPLGETHLPYTIRVELHRGDVEEQDGTVKLVSVCGHEISQTGDQLHVLTTATVPELGSTFTQAQVYAIPEAISPTPLGGIDPTDGVPSRRRADWVNFEA